ncbi:MAG: 4Fe-4S binding protein [Candidatus Geothermincolales bacterium]
MGYSRRVVDLFLRLWPLTHVLKRWSSNPLIGKAFSPFLGERIFQATFVPVAEEVPIVGSSPLPLEALRRLVITSSHRFIYHNCICRTQESCQRYPRDFGCIYLGDAAAHLHPSLGRLATVEECLEHVERGADLGLVGMVGRLWTDAVALGVLRQFPRFLVICFCCDCCCLVRTDMKGAGPELKAAIKRISSLSVEVGESCVGCGTCAETCFVGAISIREGRAHVDDDACKGCGRCVQVCPQGSLRIKLDEEDRLWRELLERVGPALGLGKRHEPG